MSTIKINIAEMSEKNGWINVKTYEGKDLSILVKDGKNPKTKAALTGVNAGQEVTLPAKIVEKDGKSFVWDAEEGKGGGGKSFTPKDKNWESSIAAANAAGNMISLTKDATTDQFDTLFNHIYLRITEKINKS